MKYMGSKSRIKKYIVPILQDIIDKNNIKMYIEPYVGGCNVIDSIKCNTKVGNDISSPLIELWKAIQRGEELPENVSRELYNDVRSNQFTEKYPLWFIGAVGFLASYNGRYFDGGYAKEGYEKGKLRNYYNEAKNNILAQKEYIMDVIFTNKDYRDMKEVKNTLIYADIPYENTKQYNTSKNFDYNCFWNWARKFSKDNIVIISELQAPSDFVCIWEQETLRSIKSKDKSYAVEKLFIHKDNISKIGGLK